MNRKARARKYDFPYATSTHAQLLANFRQQMADHARGERLRQLRTKRRLNQEDAAHEIGVSAKTLRTWEKGGPIKWENAKSAASFYEVDAESLVSREPDLTPLSVEGDGDRLARIEASLEAIEDAMIQVLSALSHSAADSAIDEVLERLQERRRTAQEQRPLAQAGR